MLKRAGRRQDPDGVGVTAQGELAVECLACPHPGFPVEICPKDGVTTQVFNHFLYFLFIYDNWNWVLHVLQLGKGWLEGLV